LTPDLFLVGPVLRFGRGVARSDETDPRNAPRSARWLKDAHSNDVGGFVNPTTRRFSLRVPEVRLSLRAAFCLSVPLLVGVASNERLYAIVFAIGALWSISQDGLDEWHVRGPRLLGVAVAAGVGVAVGATFVNHAGSEWALLVLFTGVALVAGFVEASDRATQGAYLLIGAIMGAGLEFTGKVWQATLCVAGGALWVYAVAALTDRRGRLSNQRIFLANAFDQLATLVGALDTSSFYARRAKAVLTLDAAQDVVGAARLRPGDDEAVALRECLVVALRTGEVVSFLEGKGRRVEPSVAEALRAVATTLREGTGVEAVSRLRELPALFQHVDGVDGRVTAAMTLSDATKERALAPRIGVPRLSHRLVPVMERCRFALILAVATAAGTAIADALDGPHGFWLPLSVAFILRPDLGPVITRALARTAGTIVGVGIAAFVSWTGNSLPSLIVLSCLMAAVTPWASRRSHVLAVMAFTPIVFVFLGLLGTEKYLFGPRIIDTALAAAIVLTLDLVLWSTAPSLRPAQQLRRAHDAARRYELDAPSDDPIRRNTLRRNALRAVSNARSALDQATAEPRLLRRSDVTSAAQLDEIESGIDAHTVSLFEGA
jgi:uncharacterized membrane protein YccC